MNREKAREIRARLEEVLRTEFPEYTVNCKAGSFTANDYTLKVQFAETSETGTAMTREYRELQIVASSYGLEDWMLEMEYDDPSLGKIKFTGYSSRSPKYPFLVKQLSTGRTYKMTRGMVSTLVTILKGKRKKGLV